MEIKRFPSESECPANFIYRKDGEVFFKFKIIAWKKFSETQIIFLFDNATRPVLQGFDCEKDTKAMCFWLKRHLGKEDKNLKWDEE